MYRESPLLCYCHKLVNDTQDTLLLVASTGYPFSVQTKSKHTTCKFRVCTRLNLEHAVHRERHDILLSHILLDNTCSVDVSAHRFRLFPERTIFYKFAGFELTTIVNRCEERHGFVLRSNLLRNKVCKVLEASVVWNLSDLLTRSYLFNLSW
jgi:hypothetical protein